MSFIREAKTFESLGNTPFRIFFFSMIGEWVAMSMVQVTQPLLVYYLTGSAAILGIMSLALAIPQLTLALFGGVLADRFPKKLLIRIGRGISATSALFVVIALATGFISKENPGSWRFLFLTSVLSGAAMAISVPAIQSYIPLLVNERQLMNAMGLHSMSTTVSQFIGPAMAGFMVDSLGYKEVYITICALYILAILIISLVPVSGMTSSGRRSSVLVDLKEGLHYVRQNSTILFIVAFAVAGMVLSAPRMSMLPIFAIDILKVGATGTGILQGICGIGAFTSALIIASMRPRRRGVLFIGAGFCLGSALAIFAFSHSWALSLAMMLFTGMGQAAHATLGLTLLQTSADDQHRGRVMSVFTMNTGLVGMGVFLCGILAENVGAPLAIGGFAITLAVIATSALLFIPRIRKLN